MWLGWANVVLGTIFLFIYYRYGRGFNIRRERKKNYLIIWILCSELIFNIAPTNIYINFYLSTSSSTSTVSGIFGSILTLAHCTDGLVQAFVFYRTWRLKASVNSNRIKAVTPMRNLIHGNTGSTVERT